MTGLSGYVLKLIGYVVRSQMSICENQIKVKREGKSRAKFEEGKKERNVHRNTQDRDIKCSQDQGNK